LVLAVRDAIAEGHISDRIYLCQFASIVGSSIAARAVSRHLGSVSPPGLRTRDRDAGGGQATQVTHSAALFLLTGLRPVSVAALTEPFELAVDLADAIVVRFANGAIGSLGSTGSVLPGQSVSSQRHSLANAPGRVSCGIGGADVCE
jgi:hypothetical protein